MAGTSGSVQNGPWYKCSDGTLIEPIDFINMFFPNKRQDSIADNACFALRHFRFPSLRSLLPQADEYYAPDDLVDSVVVLFVLSIFVTIAMIVSKKVWCWLDPHFAAVNPTHKQWYVVANLSKSVFLACLATSSRFWIGAYREFFLDEFQMLEVKRWAIVYSVTDFVALFMVPKLPRSTILHHVTTTTLCLMFSGINLTQKGWGGLLGVSKMAIVYGVCSTPSFPVNAYLALRVVYPKAKWLPALVKFSLWTYILCCTVNWTVHTLWLTGLFLDWDISVFILLYMTALLVMVNDDIVLIRWLIRRSSPMAMDGNTNEKKE